MILLPLLALVVAVAVLIAAATVDADPASPRVSVWQPLERRVAWFALACALVAAAAVLVIPSYEMVSVMQAGRDEVSHRREVTFLATHGPGALLPLLFPVLLAAVPLFPAAAHQRRVRAATVAVVMLALSVIAGFSIGLFFVPSALALLTVAILGVVTERSA